MFIPDEGGHSPLGNTKFDSTGDRYYDCVAVR